MVFAKECRSVPVQYSMDRWRSGRRKMQRTSPRLLHVDEEVALKDVLPFLVLLGLFVRLVLLKPE